MPNSCLVESEDVEPWICGGLIIKLHLNFSAVGGSVPLRVAQYFICMFSFLLRIYLTVDLLDYRITPSFPGGSVGEESACNAEGGFHPQVESPWRRA